MASPSPPPTARPGAFKGRKSSTRESGIDPSTFGNIPGIPVGKSFKDRMACSQAGVHAPLRSGIHGKGKEGAYSVVLSGGYDDDEDRGDIIIYTGEGGRDTSGTKIDQMRGKEQWGGPQVADQKWLRGNKALQTSSLTKKPIRVIRGDGLASEYAPASGYRYDGLYIVNKAWREKGKTGFLMCRFEFERLRQQLPLPRPKTYGSLGAGAARTSHFDSSVTTSRVGTSNAGSSQIGSGGPGGPVRRPKPIVVPRNTQRSDLAGAPSRPAKAVQGPALAAPIQRIPPKPNVSHIPSKGNAQALLSGGPASVRLPRAADGPSTAPKLATGSTSALLSSGPALARRPLAMVDATSSDRASSSSSNRVPGPSRIKKRPLSSDDDGDIGPARRARIFSESSSDSEVDRKRVKIGSSSNHGLERPSSSRHQLPPVSFGRSYSRDNRTDLTSEGRCSSTSHTAGPYKRQFEGVDADDVMDLKRLRMASDP